MPKNSGFQIGADGGFLASPIALDQLLLAPAERADTIVDFSSFEPGTEITLLNIGPDEPFAGGTPGVDFTSANPATTGQVMKFRVVALASVDDSTPPAQLRLPAPVATGAATHVRRLSLNELDSDDLCIAARGKPRSCTSREEESYGPIRALLGTVDDVGFPVPLGFSDPATEQISLGTVEIWEIYNFTADAHPIHLHLVQFEVVDRQALASNDADDVELPVRLVGEPRLPEPWETGRKDTVVVYPREVARVKAAFDLQGRFLWHCHILEHEDNEMMRPLLVH
ncbi:MAG TPA: multicopper oxidase domain-containing protein [Kofleriaceae bacterium]|nr:multicopper oxidase domain-containing protein [Kofleriaceae bacterium]